MSDRLDGGPRSESVTCWLTASFGKVWIGRLILTIVIIVLIWSRFEVQISPRRGCGRARVLAAVLLVSLAG